MNSPRSTSEGGNRLLSLLKQNRRAAQGGRDMTLADRIRAHVGRACICPARDAGRKEITIRAGDVHSRMGLVGRMPAVCGALRSRKLEEAFGVRLLRQTGPYQGANARYEFGILGADESPDLREETAPEASHEVTSGGSPAPVPPAVPVLGGDTVVLVSCVSQKRARATAAKDLYVSDWFVKARAYAERLGVPWFILSAEYGLVDPDAVIAPYEKTLNTMSSPARRDWADRVFSQLRSAAPDARSVVFLAGARYREFLAERLRARGITVEVPMQGLRIGEQLSWLGRQVRHE